MGQESITYVEPVADDWKGTARYEVLGRLGKGGMGVVYEVFDRERRELVALKTLLHFDSAGLYLVKQEFRTLAGVHHRNLVHLHELGVTEAGQVFFTMELLRGHDFRQYVRRPEARAPSVKLSAPPPTLALAQGDRETAPPPRPDATQGATSVPKEESPANMDRLVAALQQLASGIHALHSAGKLHRDIKPSNVLVTREGRVVLLDFGVATELASRGAKASTGSAGSGEVVGTARYMAPEQGDDAPPSPASDWYSVGVMLYEVLVGRPPFLGSLTDILVMKGRIDPPPPSECVRGVPPKLDALCRSLLDRDPARRPTGLEILAELGATHSSAPPPNPVGGADASSAFIGREGQLTALRASGSPCVSAARQAWASRPS